MTAELCKERTMRERVKLGGLGLAAVNSRKTSKSVDAVDVHGTRSADSLSARSSESQGRVEVVLDFDLLRQTSAISSLIIPLWCNLHRSPEHPGPWVHTGRGRACKTEESASHWGDRGSANGRED
jgi:hypothetical protein